LFQQQGKTKQMNSKETKIEIRNLKREMKENGIKVVSCFNGGHSRESLSYNQRLFKLKTQLERETKDENIIENFNYVGNINHY
jgi:hypothetical protein